MGVLPLPRKGEHPHRLETRLGRLARNADV